MSISTDCRNESLEQTNTSKRAKEVLAVFEDGRYLTTREVLGIVKPGSDDINYVQPRISELRDGGYLEEAGKVYDDYTHRKVTVWRKTKDD